MITHILILGPNGTEFKFGDHCEANDSLFPFNCTVTKKKTDITREVNCIFFKFGPTDTANGFQVDEVALTLILIIPYFHSSHVADVFNLLTY